MSDIPNDDDRDGTADDRDATERLLGSTPPEVNPTFGQYAGGRDEPAAPVPADAVHGSEGMPGEFGYGVHADDITYVPPPKRVLRPEDGVPSEKVSGQG